jgi:hypothetical protein
MIYLVAHCRIWQLVIATENEIDLPSLLGCISEHTCTTHTGCGGPVRVAAWCDPCCGGTMILRNFE